MIDAGIIDANILLRYIVFDNPQQAEQAEILLDRIAAGEASGTLLPTVFLEIVYILERHYGFDRGRIAHALSAVLSMNGVDVVDRAQLIAAAAEYRTRRSVSFADAYHCAMARDFHEGNLVSFDRKLDGVPGVTRREPGSFNPET